MQFFQNFRFLKDLHCRMKKKPHLLINYLKICTFIFYIPRIHLQIVFLNSKIDRLCTIVISSSRLLILKSFCVPFELNLHTCFPLLALFFLIRALRLVWTKLLQIDATCHRMHRKDKNKLLLMGVDFFGKCFYLNQLFSVHTPFPSCQTFWVKNLE